MLTVNTTTKNHYIQDESLHKELRIDFTPKNSLLATSVGNDAIVAEQFELEQHLCDAEVDFVGCVSSTCKFTLWNIFGDYDVGTKVEVYVTADDCQEIKLFTGYVNESEANFENGEVEYVCYDLIGYDYLSNWKFGDTLSSYLETHTAMVVSDVLTLMEQRSYQYHLDIVYDTLPNNILILADQETGLVETFKGMSALDILKYICQLEGMFGVINNLGQFELRKINPDGNYNGAYPGNSTYPSNDLYPGVQNAGRTGEFILITYEDFKSSSRLTKTEPPVNGIWIIETEDSSVDKSADNRRDVKNYGDYILVNNNPTGTPFSGSVLKIIGNPFIHDKSSSLKLEIANNIQSVAGGYTYYPYEAKGKGLPFVEVGDYVDYIVTDWNEKGAKHHQMVSCLVLSRVLKGIQHMTDTYSAKIVDDWKSEETIHYIQALPACTNVTDAIENEDLYSDINDTIDEQVTEQIEEKANVWNVETVEYYPYSPNPKTIYLIRGLVEMHSVSETLGEDDIGDFDNEGQTNQ